MERVRDMIKTGSVVSIYKIDGFRYKGRVESTDDEFICIFDFRTNKRIFIKWNFIKNIEEESE